jgi:hypothetical protein
LHYAPGLGVGKLCGNRYQTQNFNITNLASLQQIKVMYIKVNKRFSMLRGCHIFQFSVIESFRENGKVKHRTLLYLSSLPSECFNYPLGAMRFWDICDEKLERFPVNDRLRLAARIETVIPRLSEQDEQETRELSLLVSGVRNLQLLIAANR